MYDIPFAFLFCIFDLLLVLKLRMFVKSRLSGLCQVQC